MADANSTASTAIRRHLVKRRNLYRDISRIYAKVREATKLAKIAKRASARVEDAEECLKIALDDVVEDEKTLLAASLKSSEADLLFNQVKVVMEHCLQKYNESKTSADKLEEVATKAKIDEQRCRHDYDLTREMTDDFSKEVQLAIEASTAAVAKANSAADEADITVIEMANTLTLDVGDDDDASTSSSDNSSDNETDTSESSSSSSDANSV